MQWNQISNKSKKRMKSIYIIIYFDQVFAWCFSINHIKCIVRQYPRNRCNLINKPWTKHWVLLRLKKVLNLFDRWLYTKWMLKQEWECNRMEIKISHQKKCSMQSHPNAFRSLFESSKYWRKRVICELHVRAIKIVMQNVIWTFYSKSFKNWNWKWNWIETDKALGYLCQIFASFFFLSLSV